MFSHICASLRIGFDSVAESICSMANHIVGQCPLVSGGLLSGLCAVRRGLLADSLQGISYHGQLLMSVVTAFHLHLHEQA